MVRRKIYGSIVAVLAITDKNEAVLITNYRIPIKRTVIELPIGLTDKKGEADMAAAKRELLEETGYTARKFEKLLVGPFNPGLVSDHLVIYLARGARRVQKPEHENGEEIKVLTVPLKKIRRFLLHPPRGVLVDWKIFSALYQLQKRGYDC